MVEELLGIEVTASEMGLKVQVLCCGSAGAPCETDYLACLDVLAYLNQILGLVAVEGFKAKSVADDDTIAIAEVGAGARYYSVESCQDVIIGLGLDIDSRVSPSSSEGTYDMASWQRVGPVLFGYGLEVEAEGGIVLERVLILLGVE